VSNYIGAGWPVEDDPGVLMAKSFYENALTGETLGASISAARREVMSNFMTSTWGAYQHYGQVNAVLVIKEES
ncbi:MAG TPA: CHAT domain-containing protein, partial [Pyrinomonadaceae bacterium]|nr:CHAT domain-containing protein [Pyrinomonadaceae bacterium]